MIAINKLLHPRQNSRGKQRRLARLLGWSALAAALLMSRNSFAGTDFAGLVLNNTVTAPVTVAAGARSTDLRSPPATYPPTVSAPIRHSTGRSCS
jgi:hypothetical protein